jgi:hypothetical protein
VTYRATVINAVTTVVRPSALVLFKLYALGHRLFRIIIDIMVPSKADAKLVAIVGLVAKVVDALGIVQLDVDVQLILEDPAIGVKKLVPFDAALPLDWSFSILPAVFGRGTRRLPMIVYRVSHRP